MKHLWLIASSLMLLGAPTHVWAFDTKDDADIEAEDMAAEAEGSQLSQAYLDQKKEEQKMDTRLEESRAQKVIQNSKTQQAYSEALIQKAETEIGSLRKQEAYAVARRQKAQNDRKIAMNNLALKIKELKMYRARVKRAQALAMHEERNVSIVKTRTAKIQNMMPAPAPKPQAKQLRKPRVAPAEVAVSR